jgi:hypothetical protein
VAGGGWQELTPTAGWSTATGPQGLVPATCHLPPATRHP